MDMFEFMINQRGYELEKNAQCPLQNCERRTCINPYAVKHHFSVRITDHSFDKSD